MLADKRDGKPVAQSASRPHDGRELKLDDLMWIIERGRVRRRVS